jgi:hypothetical protein
MAQDTSRPSQASRRLTCQESRFSFLHKCSWTASRRVPARSVDLPARNQLKPSECVSRIGDSASAQAVTRVNAEQALYGVFIVKRFLGAAIFLAFLIEIATPIGSCLAALERCQNEPDLSHGVLCRFRQVSQSGQHNALQLVGRACFATAPSAPACRPSRYRSRSRAPTGVPLHVVHHWVRARYLPGEHPRSAESDHGPADGAPYRGATQPTCWTVWVRARAGQIFEALGGRAGRPLRRRGRH